MQETCYKTTDNTCFSSKEKAEYYQKKLDFMKNIKDLYPKARKTFNLTKELDTDNPSVEELLQKFRLDESIWDIGNFEELLYCLVYLYLEIPELSNFFKLVEKRFNSYNND